MPGDQHDLGIGQHVPVGEQIHPVAVGQLQIEQDDVRLLQGDLAPRVAQAVHHRHGEAFAHDQGLQGGSRIHIVIDDQGVCHLTVASVVV